MKLFWISSIIFVAIIFELIAINSLSRSKIIYKNRKITREVDDIYFMILIEYAKWHVVDEFKIVYEECVGVNINHDILLRVAALYYNYDIVYYLIDEKGLDIHTNEEFLLRYAIFGNDLYLVNYALSRGADLHIKNDDILHDVIEKQKIDILKLLLIYNKTYNETLIQNMINISKSEKIIEILEDYMIILDHRNN